MQKVDGVQTVRVRLNDGITILDLKPGNTVTLAALRQIIKNNGFVSQEARMTARGVASTVDGKDYFDVAGTQERLTLSEGPKASGDAWELMVAAPPR